MQFDTNIRTPKLLYYDRKDHVLVMEDVGNLPSLKGWLQPGVSRQAATDVGLALGKFLATVHNMTASAAEIKARFHGNATAKYLSGTLYFGGLPAAAEKFGFKEDFIQDAARVGQQEVSEADDVLTLGDFWTGNILVGSNPDQGVSLYVIDLELSKPGTAEFDVGQMAAEMYCLEVFRDQKLGSILLRSFLESYRDARESPVDAAKVAIRIGVHLVVIMPRAWSTEGCTEQIDQAVSYAVDLIRIGHSRDEGRLSSSIVGLLVASGP